VANQRHSRLRRLVSLPPDAAEPDPEYRALLDWIWSFSARPRSAEEVVSQRAVKLDRMRALLDLLGWPHTRYPSLLVAGTKGKGSTVAMLDASLRAAGHRTGRYTSPHLVNWRERTCVDGAPVTADEVVSLGEDLRAAVRKLAPRLEAPTTFEVGTAFTLLYFARAGVDVAVLEVGVGGTHDATNVVDPLVSAITPISYDHTPTLGSTLTRIAEHKAGVLRPGRPGVVGRQPAEAMATIERIAAELPTRIEVVGRDWTWSVQAGEDAARAPIRIRNTSGDLVVDDVRVPLLGDHQRDNATLATAVLASLGETWPRLMVPTAAIREGLAGVVWPGRLQVLEERPLLVVDGAHNAASAVAVRDAIAASFRFRDLWLVVGLSAGKDAEGVLGALAPVARGVVLTRAKHERAAPTAELAAVVNDVSPTTPTWCEPDLTSALATVRAQAREADLILVTGSLFLVGETLATT
jgi:dihydrofolate synthase / folylpolyglutamate synthase